MKSPFQYGTLVDKESFVNRVEERKQLKELLGSGINVMLISPRRWGKSSLVKVAMDELTQEDKHIRICFIDAFSIKTEAEFYRIFAREVISCAASTLEKRLEDVKQFLKAVSPSMTLKSDPTDTLSFDLKLELEEKSVMEILELPEKIAAAKGIHLIVCIDEFQQLGWFVTDRNQPADTVCLYTFIPTQTRRIYNEEELGEQKLAAFARIASIKDTWTDMNAVNAAQKRLAEARQEQKNEKKNRDFTFVINDNKTYYNLFDFKDPLAQQKAKIWLETEKEYQAKQKELETLRTRYATMTEVQRVQIAPQIRLTETAVERLAADKLKLEKEIRRTELNQ